jgi:hypothetical protein
MKRKEHPIIPTDIELNRWEFQLVMGEAWKDRDLFTESIFCTCDSPEKKLIDFKVYLTRLNDLVLKGKCSGCQSIAARYIETGENKDNFEAAERIRKMKREK